MTSRAKEDGDGKLETGLVDFLCEVQTAVQQYLPSVPLRTVHKRQGLIFHGQNKF
jgi:hypothetical protein